MPREFKAVLAEHQEVVAALAESAGVLDEMSRALVSAFRRGRRVYIVGNGGSAADAQHIAAELLGRFRLERHALPAVALSTDTSCLTAIANDLGYEHVFARQLEGLLEPGDVVWVLSTSGASSNVRRAVEVAERREATTLVFTGAAGGELAAACTLAFQVPHRSADRIQEAHELAYHYICERVEAELA